MTSGATDDDGASPAGAGAETNERVAERGVDGSTATNHGDATTEAHETGGDRGTLTRKRCVLITGCSSGIGRSTAHRFLEADWHVVATARSLEDIEDLADAGCHTLELDVTDSEQVARAVERTVDVGGAIDCLVNNAGYAKLGPTEDLPTAAVHRQFDVNVYGPHRLARAALPHMRAQESGRIVNVSSVLGRVAVAGTGAYAGSKHALEAMSDALRAEVEEFGLEVVVIEPGPVESAFSERATDEIPSGRTPAYEGLYDLFEETKLLGGGGPLAVEPGAVADAILHAGTCPDPPARYPVGPVAQYGLYARFLPDRVRDAIYGLVRKVA